MIRVGTVAHNAIVMAKCGLKVAHNMFKGLMRMDVGVAHSFQELQLHMF